jgi:hypothetical protein
MVSWGIEIFTIQKDLKKTMRNQQWKLERRSQREGTIAQSMVVWKLRDERRNKQPCQTYYHIK